MNKLRRNIYHHSVDIKKLKIKNTHQLEFSEKLNSIDYRGYEVEDISDGRKIVIVKPGGKKSYGRISKEDFFVFIYSPNENSLWQITHKQIYQDLKEKGNANPQAAAAIINALERVYNGEEPDDFLSDLNLENPSGENPEAIIKAYKWIWGQEDVNYPPPKGKGRTMVWEGWKKEGGEWYKNGTGILDLKNALIEKLSK